MGEKDHISSLLQKIYSTPSSPGSFSSASKIKNVLLQNHKMHMPLATIQNWLDDQRAYSLHKKSLHNFGTNPIVVSRLDQQWQGDLLFLPDLAKYNEGIKIILIVIDVASRFVWVEPLKSKSGLETTRGFQSILEKAAPRKPEKFQTDDGTEFFNKHFDQLMKTHLINHFSIKSDKKAAIAERMIRTLKDKIYRFLDNQPGNNKYLPHLQDLVDSYNNTVHSKLKMAPIAVTLHTLGDALGNLYDHVTNPKKPVKPMKQFKIGDSVRISNARHPFRKGYKGNWSEEIFTIYQVKNALPHTVYKIKDYQGEKIEGVFYGQELYKVAVSGETVYYIENILKTRQKKGRDKEYLIRWEGYDEKFDSWEPESSIVNLLDDYKKSKAV